MASASNSIAVFGAQDLDDKVHDVFLIIAEAICKGDLREPDRLMAFVSTVVRRQVAGYIDGAVRMRAKHTILESEMAVSDNRPDRSAARSIARPTT